MSRIRQAVARWIWRAIIAATATAWLASPALAAPPGQGACWEKIWGDEFSGTALDARKWTVATAASRGIGAWRADAVRVRKGMLEISARLENGLLVTGGISSENTVTMTGGYLEARVRLPIVPGFRPGLWFSSLHINDVDFPTHPTEIDLFEQPTRDGRVIQALHWNGYGARHQTVGGYVPAVLALSQFHLFGMWWAKDEYRFYIDGTLSWRSRGGGISTGPEFLRIGNEPFNAGVFRGIMPDAASFAQARPLQIDYVRAYSEIPCGNSANRRGTAD